MQLVIIAAAQWFLYDIVNEFFLWGHHYIYNTRDRCSGWFSVVYQVQQRGSAVVSTSACHAGGRRSLPGPATLLGVKTLLSTLYIVYLCVFRMRH